MTVKELIEQLQEFPADARLDIWSVFDVKNGCRRHGRFSVRVIFQDSPRVTVFLDHDDSLNGRGVL